MTNTLRSVTPTPTNTLGLVKRRGRPPSGKVMVTIRLDPDVVGWFRATGPGWQARINDALKDRIKVKV